MKYSVSLNGKNYEVEVDQTKAVITSVSDAPAASAAPVPAPVQAAAPTAPAASPVATAAGNKVIAPMPGTILSVSVTVGQAVKAGDVILILEAMKMENEIVAPCAGTVNQLLVQKGSTVDTNAVLAVIG